MVSKSGSLGHGKEVNMQTGFTGNSGRCSQRFSPFGEKPGMGLGDGWRRWQVSVISPWYSSLAFSFLMDFHPVSVPLPRGSPSSYSRCSVPQAGRLVPGSKKSDYQTVTSSETSGFWRAREGAGWWGGRRLRAHAHPSYGNRKECRRQLVALASPVAALATRLPLAA